MMRSKDYGKLLQHEHQVTLIYSKHIICRAIRDHSIYKDSVSFMLKGKSFVVILFCSL